MNFLTDLSESFKSETNMTIKYSIINDLIIFKVLDSRKKSLKGVQLYFNNKSMGVTDNKGVLKVEKKALSSRGILKAVKGVYVSTARFKG